MNKNIYNLSSSFRRSGLPTAFRSRARRVGLSSMLTSALLLALFLGDVAFAQRTNVLVIVLDDLNTWVEPIGEYAQVHTPAMNRLAEQGVTFSQAYCQAPICAPSRASFMGGLRPSTTGLYSLGSTLYNHPTYGSANHKTMHRYFKDAGYVTATVGKVFHSEAELNAIASSLDYRGPGTDYGPTRTPKLTNPGVSGANALVDWGAYPASDTQMPDYQTVTWATNRLTEFATNTAPFFMTVGIVRPHVPMYAPQPWFDLYPEGSFALPFYAPDDLADTPRFARYLHWKLPEPRTEALIAFNEWTNHTRAYLACVSFADAMIGRLLDGLAAQNLASNTVVVLFSDHGYHLGEKGLTAKTTLWDRATRVPLIVAGPGVSGRGKCAQAVELLDVYPTLLDLSGLPPYAPLQGESLRPLLADPTNAPPRRPAIVTHGPRNHSVVDGRYRYIRYADGTEEFYDHAVDPNEEFNRIEHPNYREKARALAAWVPTNNAPNISGTSRIAEIGADKVVRWEGSPIYDPEDPGYNGGRLDGANWIWTYNSTSVPGGAVAHFRRGFKVTNPSGVASAMLSATADNVVEAWINGVPLFTNTAWRDLTVTNVAAHLLAGSNVIALKATNLSGAAGPAALLASLEIQWTNELSDYFVTESNAWKAASSATGTAWTTPAFDDSGWTPPAIIAPFGSGPWGTQVTNGTPVRRDVIVTPITDDPTKDDDADLLPDWWERHYTGATNVLLGLTTDFDGDGATDVGEYAMGTDPTDAGKVLKLSLDLPTNGIWRVGFNSELGRDYRLFGSANLQQWSATSSSEPGTGGLLFFALMSAGFYRVEAR